MRILIITPVFPPDIGGPATYVYELSKRLVKQRHEVFIIAHSENMHFQRNLNDFALKIFRLPFYNRFSGNNSLFRILHAIKKFIELRVAPDIIYVHDPFMTGIPGIFGKFIKRCPLVLKLVGDLAWEISQRHHWTSQNLVDFHAALPLRGYLLEIAQYQIFTFCNKIIMPSRFLKELFKPLCNPDKIVIIPNAVEIDENIQKADKTEIKTKLGLNKFSIFAAGRLVPWKGFDGLVSLIPQLVKDYPQIRLNIAGEGPLKPLLSELIKKLGMTNQIQLLGRLDKTQLLEYMRASDVFIMNSSYEGLSHTIIEALGCKIPVIATKVGGNRELIKHKWNGLLVNYNDQIQLENAVRTIYENKKMAAYLAENGVKAFKRFTWNNHISKLLALFREII